MERQVYFIATPNVALEIHNSIDSALKVLPNSDATSEVDSAVVETLTQQMKALGHTDEVIQSQIDEFIGFASSLGLFPVDATPEAVGSFLRERGLDDPRILDELILPVLMNWVKEQMTQPDDWLSLEVAYEFYFNHLADLIDPFPTDRGEIN